MADDALSIRNLNWREIFPFLNLFRAFRVAIHPSKLVLGFALLVLVYCGGRVLDVIWPVSSYAIPQEIDAYTAYQWSHERGFAFEDRRDQHRAHITAEYEQQLHDAGIVKDETQAHDDALHAKYEGKLRQRIVQQRNDALVQAKKNHDERIADINKEKNVSEKDRNHAIKQVDERLDSDEKSAEQSMLGAFEQLNAITPRPIFDSFFEYEVRQFEKVISNALAWRWFNGINIGGANESPDLSGRHPEAMGNTEVGVIQCAANFIVIGPGWLMRYHWLYFILFAAWFLLIWAIFGGALARVAAVHVARDEKISVRQALRFSTNKLLSFIFAPLIPLIIILVAGLVVAVGGLLLYIPVIGPIVVGALYILALLAGLLITLVATGTIGGFNLMYPTIAVEGSDSFDAISRSFSYIFARPWRMIFYTVVTLVYGALCFLFVRYFVYVILSVAHFFTACFLRGEHTQPGHYWPQIWPSVSDQDLAYRINFQGLAWSESIAAVLIAIWVYIVLSMLASFVVSFYFSSNTIIYFLMRREVDATEMDDVYIEEAEEDFGDAVMAAGVVTPTTAPETPPPAAPPATPTTQS